MYWSTGFAAAAMQWWQDLTKLEVALYPVRQLRNGAYKLIEANSNQKKIESIFLSERKRERGPSDEVTWSCERLPRIASRRIIKLLRGQWGCTSRTPLCQHRWRILKWSFHIADWIWLLFPQTLVSELDTLKQNSSRFSKGILRGRLQRGLCRQIGEK